MIDTQTHRLDIDRPCLLTASGDADLVEVTRSPLVTVGSRLLAPVLDYLASHGLRSVYRETEEDPHWAYGQRIREIYSTENPAGRGDK